jgi:YD repeat-containing protein
MGWTLGYANKTGKHSETTSYSGATLPAPFATSGGNTSTTGTVTTDISAERTLVTDQAAKKRISKINALGQLTDVWEVTASDGSTVSVTFPGTPGTGIAYGYQTSYTYDPLGNLAGVSQGSQTRTFAYNNLSRLTSATNPESGTISYGYDNNGNLTGKSQLCSGTDKVVNTAYTYDALNRVLQRSYTTPNGAPTNYQTTPTVDYTYDGQSHAKGKLTKVVRRFRRPNILRSICWGALPRISRPPTLTITLRPTPIICAAL